MKLIESLRAAVNYMKRALGITPAGRQVRFFEAVDQSYPEHYVSKGKDVGGTPIDEKAGRTLRGTFPLDPPTDADSRQVRRFKIRTAVFNRLATSGAPRNVRRAVARKARLAQ